MNAKEIEKEEKAMMNETHALVLTVKKNGGWI